MNRPETVKVFGKDYPTKNIRYSYTGRVLRFKKQLVYLLGALFFTFIRSIYLSLQIANLDNVTPQFEISIRTQIENIVFIQEIMIVAFIVLLIPRTGCVFLKIDGIKKDIILFKSIHKDEIAIISNEINSKIKENTFHSFPY